VTVDGATVAGVLTPAIEGPKVPVRRWIALQAELLRVAAACGDAAAIAVLRFADLIPERGGDADLTPALDVGTACMAIANDHWYPDLADALRHGHDEVVGLLETTHPTSLSRAIHDCALDRAPRS